MLNRAILLSSVICAAAFAQTPQMKPFAIQWVDRPDSPADLSFLNKGPAGKDGFVRAAGGHLVLPDGSRLRIWGINATGKAGLPLKSDAPVVAGNLARLGINCVRFHFLDRPAPNGIIDPNRNDTRALDAGQLDKLDFFIAELKNRGIYSDLNLNVARGYKPGDNVREAEYLGFAKSLTYFDPRIIELEKEYATQLLTHRNSYTGNEYRSEPAVAMVEMLNENSLVEAWFGGRLLGKGTQKNPGTWADIPSSYEKDLTELFNAWLIQQKTRQDIAAIRAEAGTAGGAMIPRLSPNQFAKASKLRFQTEAEFYMAVERDFFKMMQKLLKDDLKVQALLVGNSDHGHNKTGYPQVAGTSLLDVVDGHVYWQHPRYTMTNGRQTGFDIQNTPMVDDPLHSTVVQLSRSAVAGKPYIVSEVNHPFPAEYECEGVPILAAYAALQDWDGIFWYTLGHADVQALRPVVQGHFDFAMDPVKLPQLAAGAMMFRRGDVKTAAYGLPRSYSREEVYESIRLPAKEQPYFTPAFPLATPLRLRVDIETLDHAPWSGQDYVHNVEGNPIRSDTHELSWYFGQKHSGLVAIDTDRSQALIGFCRERKIETKNLKADLATEFCSLTLNALDDRPIAQSSKLLLTAAANLSNTGQEWNEKRTTLTKWGTEPTLIEIVTGKVILRNLDGAKRVDAQPLDGAGRPQGEPIAGTKEGDGWVIPLGSMATTWYVVKVER